MRVVDVAGVATGDGFVTSVHRILAELVLGGSALGWVEPPDRYEVAALLADVGRAAADGDAALLAAYDAAYDAAFEEGRLLGFGYWRRYSRPTHRPHADLEKVAVDAAAQGRGVGRALTAALVEAARVHRIEVLTLDARGDNETALGLYRSLGFTEYGRLSDFVAFGERRYDKVFYALDLRNQSRS